MSWAQHRLKLKQTPIDSWSLKEQLTLALAVMRTGDQNWVSVSRTMKQFNEPGRPMDWYSQKNCALQYNLIMENGDIPKRKRGEKLDAKDDPGQTIVRVLGRKRTEQLNEIIDQEKEEIAKLEKQVELLSSDNVSEEQLEKILQEIYAEEEEEEKKRDEHAQFIKQREDKKMAIQAALKTGYYVRGASAAAAAAAAAAAGHSSSSSAVMTTASNLSTTSSNSELSSSPSRRIEEPASVVKEPSEIKVENDATKEQSSTTPTSTTNIDENKETSNEPTTVKKEPESSTVEVKHEVIDIPDDTITVKKEYDDKSKDNQAESSEAIVVKAEKGEEEKGAVKKVEPDVVDLEPPTAEEDNKKVTAVATSSAMESDHNDSDDDDVINDAEEIQAANITDEISESDLKAEVKEEIKEEKMDVDEVTPTTTTTANPPTEEAIKQEAIATPEETTKDKLEQVESSSEPMEVSQEVAKEEKADEATVSTASDAATENPPTTVLKNAPTTISTTTTTVATTVEKPAEASSTAPIEINPPQEIDIEAKKVISKPAGRRGRRSKKNSEVVPEPTPTISSSSTPTIQSSEEPESSGQLTAAFSSPASTRPPSPSQESQDTPTSTSTTQSQPHTHQIPSTPKLLEQTSSRLKARRSSRQGIARALKEGNTSNSSPVSPLMSSEEEKEYKSWKKGVLLVWNQIAAHKHANIFAGPVSETEAPDYKDVVFEPMDLGTIKKNIEAGVIKTTEEFQRDLGLMFFNAVMYNSSSHPVHMRTLAMQKDTDKMIREFLNTQALMKANEAPKLRTKEAVKVLTSSRTRTGSGSQSALEDKKKSL